MRRLSDEDLLVRDAAVEHCDVKNGEFEFRHIEPTAVLWRIIPFEPLDELCAVFKLALRQSEGLRATASKDAGRSGSLFEPRY